MATAKIRSAITLMYTASTKELAPNLPRELSLPDGRKCYLCLATASDLSAHAEDTLYNLFDQNLASLSKHTSMAYLESSKRIELFDYTTRFLLVTTEDIRSQDEIVGGDSVPMPGALPLPESSRSTGKRREGSKVDISPDQLLGFCSFRFDTEETMTSKNVEVIYCYELQLSTSSRGLGLGKILMDELEAIGRRRKMEKAMLTCLSNNHTALKFYTKQGYTPDEIDPTRISNEEEGDDTYAGDEEDEWEDIGKPKEDQDEGEGEGSDGEVDYRILSKILKHR